MTAVEAVRPLSPDASQVDGRPVEPDRSAATRCSVRPAPEREPSFDDEPRSRHLHLIQAVATPQLPFPRPVSTPVSRPISMRPALPGQPESVRRLTVVPDLSEPAGSGTAPAVAPPSAAQPTPPEHTAEHMPQDTLELAPLPTGPPASSALRGTYRPDPSRFSRQFAQGVVEVLSGRRPMVQLIRHVSPAVQRGLIRAGGSHPLESAQAPTLHSLHLSEPAAGVCEMSAIVVVGVRYRALAARLEWKIDHWRCTALQIG